MHREPGKQGMLASGLQVHSKEQYAEFEMRQMQNGFSAQGGSNLRRLAECAQKGLHHKIGCRMHC